MFFKRLEDGKNNFNKKGEVNLAISKNCTIFQRTKVKNILLRFTKIAIIYEKLDSVLLKKCCIVY